MASVYILLCANGKYYVGSTENLEERLKRHNAGYGCGFTKAHLPVKLIYKEEYLTIEEAFLYNYRDLTLEKLSDLVHLGRRQTERLLKKHYNKTFLQKKTEARMSAACILLQDPNVSIASVAYELGYSSSEHFTNAFKTFYHMTPSAYRSKGPNP